MRSAIRRRPRAKIAAVLALLALVAATFVATARPTTAAFTDTGSTTSTLATVEAANTFTQVVAGTDFTLVLTSTGQVWAWGTNQLGQLGDGTTTTRQSPVQTRLPKDVTFASIDAGVGTSIARTHDGQVYFWGTVGTTYSTPTLMSGFDAPVVGVAAGNAYYLVWTASGTLYSWGNGGAGRLGREATGVNPTPQVVTAAGASSGGIVGASAGPYSGVAWRANGDVLAWGWQHGTAAGKVIANVPAGAIREVDVGFTTILLLLETGQLYRSSAGGSAFVPHTTAAVGPQITGVTDITASTSGALDADTFVATRGHSILAWGANTFGQWGNGTTSTYRPEFPTEVGLGSIGDPGIVSVSVGAGHTVLLTDQGTLSLAGNGSLGQMGRGDSVSSTVFTTPWDLVQWP